MATLLLSAAGSALGSTLLPNGVGFLGTTISGATIGGLVGAGIGSYVDAKLFGPGATHAQGPRLSDLQVMASTEGAPIPRIYGRARLAGQIVWATKFREHASTQSSGGGKGGGGGGTVTEYSYTVSFAVALCEGVITRIGRVWADGKPLATADLTWRVYKGDDAQMPDAIIEAVEGADAAPAYRGTAYVVFEEFDLSPFGNRIPQLSFEVFRALGRAEELIRAVSVIPGAGEFVYETESVREVLDEATTRGVNAHSSEGATDWHAPMNQLQATCPNVGSASLVVTWFGDDLRCGACSIQPKVEVSHKLTLPAEWSVAGMERNAAETVSEIDGRPAYGGTPSDRSVIGALRDMKARGLRTVFYPFVMMDIPADNAKPDPYAAEGTQAPYPWRGRITCHPAAGVDGSVDKTADAASQVAAFFGTAAEEDFSVSPDGVVSYAGPAEWSYRRMILHYAHLCAAAGGVDIFLIGSELRGLTQIRSDASTYPTVAALRALASDVRAVLGGSTKISYAADWSEYFGHQPTDGSGDVLFHLDPLWADSAIDFIGIDNYAPLTDWRKTASHLDADAGARTIYDLDYLRSRIAGGENFDWYYASGSDRDAQIRSPISDGAYGKPWVYRSKDLRSWWANAHYDRPGGVESGTVTEWVPQSKPLVFTEIGCPAIDKGTNAPNLFVDPKSSESAWPHYSAGTRDDFIQRCFIEAQMTYWAESGAHNPISSVYGGPMLAAEDIFFWTWDARPYPAFPDRQDIWADGAQWRFGHWLNGRLGAAPLGELVRVILAEAGFIDCDTSLLSGSVEGFVIDRIMSPRNALEPLMLARFFDAAESGGIISFRHLGGGALAALTPDELAVEDDSAAPGYVLTRGQETELPLSAKLTYIDGNLDYRQAAAESRRLSVRSQRVASAALPMVLTQEDAQATVDIWLQSSWVKRERAKLSLPPSLLALEPGDIVQLVLPERSAAYRLSSITDRGLREAEAVQSEASLFGPAETPQRNYKAPSISDYGVPLVEFLDLPLLTGGEKPYAPRVAAAAKPWPGGIALYKSAGGGFILDKVLTREATMGRTLTDLPRGVTGRWDRRANLTVNLVSGTLSSYDALSVLAGGNAAALKTPSGDWEVVQFREAVLVAAWTYELRGLLRGQAGTEGVMQDFLAAGARFVLLDHAIFETGLLEGERMLERNWAYGPASKSIDDPSYAYQTRAFSGVGLRPFSPAHLKAKRSGGGDILLSWIRRTRIDGDNWAASDVPLGEDSEAYEVDILDSGNVVRTIAANTSLVTYAAAEQMADFGTTSFSSLEISVTQLSRAYGRGTERKVMLNV